MDETKIIDDSTIEVTTKDIVEVTQTYNYDFLVKQRQDILEQRERDNAQRDKEIEEVDSLLNQFVIKSTE